MTSRLPNRHLHTETTWKDYEQAAHSDVLCCPLPGHDQGGLLLVGVEGEDVVDGQRVARVNDARRMMRSTCNLSSVKLNSSIMRAHWSLV